MRVRFYYGWVIVAVAFVCLALAYALWYSFSVFFVAMLAEFGWSRAGTALVGSTFMVVYGLSSPLTGIAVDRFGPRVVVPAGAVLLAAGLFGSSQVSEPWHIYVFYGVFTGIGVNLVGSMVQSIVLANWFSRRRGTAIGLAAAGIGVGTLVGVPALQKLIEVAGWRTAYLCLGAVILVVIPPLAIKFHRHRPEDMGLLPDGGPPRQPAEERRRPATRVVDQAWAEHTWTVRDALRTRRFWFLGAMLFFAPLAHQAVMVHQVAYLVDRGLHPMFGASLVGLVGISGSAGKILWGWVSDRIGREGAYSLGMLCIVCGIVLLSSLSDATQTWRLYAYALVFGMGYGASAPLNPAIVADVFQGRRFGSIYGMVYIGAGAGAALGPWTSGLVFDLTRSYDGAFLLSSLAALLSLVFVWLAAPGKVRQVPGVAARSRAKTEAKATR